MLPAHLQQGEHSDLLSAAAQAKYGLLSPMEQLVLLAAAQGSEDKEIAALLCCSISTVRTLWQRAYKKTRVMSRRQLIATLWREALRLARL
jgi:DNA-binding CsgD family transcriptional regulator